MGRESAYLLKLSEIGEEGRECTDVYGRKISSSSGIADFETFSRADHLADLTNDTHVCYGAALRVLDGVRLRRQVRFSGVSF